MFDKVLVSALVLAGTLLVGIAVHGHRPKPPKGSFTKVTVSGPVVSYPNNLSLELKEKKVKHLRLPKEQTVLILGEIGEDAANTASEITTKALKGKPLYILINSPGGSVLDGALIISAMESVKVPVYTVCMQICASMAAIIHQYGTKRMMLDRSVLMFHDAAGGVQGYLPMIHAQLAMFERYCLKFDAYIANRTGMNLVDLTNLQSKNIWIDGEDALDKKFNDSLAYVDVLGDDGEPLNMHEILKPKLTSEPTKTNTTATNPNTIVIPNLVNTL